MGKYFWVIFLLLGLWQWIGTLAERAAKKQQDRRVTDLAAKRRLQQTAGGPTAAGGPAGRATGPVVADRAGELASRRKAQLDELRRRRGGATAQAPARTRPTAATLRPAQAPMSRPGAPPAAAPPRLPAPVRRPAAARPQARRPAPQQQQQQQQQRRPARPVARPTETARLARRTHEVVQTKGPRELALPGLGGVPMDRTLLRRMMLYREILEPPIALREVQTWER